MNKNFQKKKIPKIIKKCLKLVFNQFLKEKKKFKICQKIPRDSLVLHKNDIVHPAIKMLRRFYG
jgi:hypothetical protein